MTTTDHIRAHLLAGLGYPHGHHRVPDLPELAHSEWCEAFEAYRRNRMLMGAFRYGLCASPEKWDGYDLVAGLKKKVAAYERTGNTEMMVDVGNYAMLIFMKPNHPRAHFRALDEHAHCPAEVTRKPERPALGPVAKLVDATPTTGRKPVLGGTK